MRIITIVNQKGGCGKTTTAVNLSAALARGGLRTLLVDLDPQSHCAVGLGVPEAKIDLELRIEKEITACLVLINTQWRRSLIEHLPHSSEQPKNSNLQGLKSFLNNAHVTHLQNDH